MMRAPRVSELDSCMTSGSKVVVNSVWVGVGWIIEGLPIRDLTEIERCHHFTKGAPYKQPDEGRQAILTSWPF